MKELIQFIKDFFNNHGLLVFISLLIEKIVGLINTIFIVRLISEADYGLITLITSAFSVGITLIGLGSNQGLLRFGTLENNPIERKKIMNYVFHAGIRRHLILILLFIGFTLFYELKYDQIWIIIIAYAVRMLGFYFYLFISSCYRIALDNKKFAQLSIIINTSGLLLTILLTLILGKYGYLIALAIGPWIALVYYKKGMFDKLVGNITSFNMNSFWKYSVNSSITYFFSEMLLMLDVFMIGIFLNENSVANYKLAIILPMNLLFIPSIFMQTDYPKIIENSMNKNYLKYYVLNYYKIFIALSILILLVGFNIKDWIIEFVFGSNNPDNGWIFYIFLIGIVFNMCLRNLYGNMLSAVGLANKNLIATISSILLMLVLSIFFIPLFGLIGAALAITLTFVFLGILSAYYFFQYIKQLD